jgi:hypothetical protein
MTAEDKSYAKRLPDDFVARSGDTFARISQIVTEQWWEQDGIALSHLIEALMPVLEPLAIPGEAVHDGHRDRCVEVVKNWFAER